MTIAWRTLLGTGLFVLPFAVIYWILSGEESGTTLLLAAVIALALLGAYIRAVGRRSGPLPEDQADAGETSDAEPDELGVFPTASVWPFVLGIGAAFAAIGFAYNGWLGLPGTGVMLMAVGGFVAESSTR